MSNARTVRQALGCTEQSAEQLAAVMHDWISPDYSESSWAELRTEFRVAAKCAGIRIEKDPTISPAKDH